MITFLDISVQYFDHNLAALYNKLQRRHISNKNFYVLSFFVWPINLGKLYFFQSEIPFC